ncbi:MAG: hypothetical protein BWY26_00458 [Elusimicrobia bacterium ADurb.Bin231]|nr:MAG: hypothetical protein BWY26_00458 [Elusimicrobia bacterium ADurb.Bin231]
MKKEIETTGNCIEEAIQKGLDQLNIKKENVDIDIIDEGKSGLFGLVGASPAKVRISLKAECSSDASLQEISAKDTEHNPETVKSEIEKIVSGILKRMDFKADVSTKYEGNCYEVKISSDDSALLIGRGGQTLGSLEFITRLILNKRGFRSARVVVNINDYLEQKREKLIEQAKQLAEKVKLSGEQVFMDLPAGERRIVHLVLKDEQGIETISEGEGRHRKLIIRRKK